MPSYANEAGVVKAIWNAIRVAYPAAWLFKVHGGPYQQAGVPDLLICVEGRLVGLEVKHQKPGESATAARERTTPLQRNEIRKLNAAGATARTVLDPAEALAAIEWALDERHNLINLPRFERK